MEQSSIFTPSLRPKSARPVRLSLLKAARALSMIALAAAVPMARSYGQALTLAPTIIVYAGNGTNGFMGDGGQAAVAEISEPKGIAYDGHGNTFIADFGNNRIRVINSAGIISTVAGTAAACTTATAAKNPCGDNGAASAAQFNKPTQMVFDTAGNLYIADYGDDRIREIALDPKTGIIDGASIVTSIAGQGTEKTSGDGGAANAAAVDQPHGVAFDRAGDLFIAEQGGCVVRKITAPVSGTATISTIAGNGTCGYNKDNVVATSSELNAPTDLAVDAAGNVYIGDEKNGRIREVLATNGFIQTIAGNGFQTCAATAPGAPNPAPACGDGGLAVNSMLGGPTGVLVDPSGDIIISDGYGARVREISAKTGNISTIAGSGQQCASDANGTGGATTGPNAYPACGDGGAATSALISFPQVVAINPQGNVQFVDDYDNKIRQIETNVDFPNTPVASTSATQNVVLQVNTAGTTINSVTVANSASGSPEFLTGTVTGCTVGGTTGNPSGSNCAIPTSFKPAYPGLQRQAIVVATNNGTFYFGVTGIGTSPLAVLESAPITTYAGTGTAGNTATGTATTSQINAPWGMAVDSQGNLFFADSGNNTVREITPAGVISTVAGGAATVCAAGTKIGDGCPATQATLSGPRGVAVDSAGDIFIADTQDQVIREVNIQTGIISTIAGGGGANGSTSGVAATSVTLSSPSDVAFDSSGTLYIADSGNNLIRTIAAGSTNITNYAGSGANCAGGTAVCGDGGQATAASFGLPNGIALDPNDNLIIADTQDNRIRLVNKATGVVTTVVGTGAVGYNDNVAATSATLNHPLRVASDAAGDYYIADQNNNAIRQVLFSTQAISTIVGGNGACTTPTAACSDGAAANAAQLNLPAGVALDGAGNIYIADQGDSKIRVVKVGSANLAFNTTPIFNTSSDSPKTAYLQDIGNMALTLSQPTMGTNASISTGYTQGTQTCPQLTNTTGSLAVGMQCSYSVSFTPTAVGLDNGSLIESDNSLNVPSTQTVNLTGTGTLFSNGPTNPSTGGSNVLTSSNATPAFGGSVTLTDTIAEVGGACPTSLATFSYTTTASATPVTLGAPTAYKQGAGATCVAAVTTTALPAGTDSVTAAYPADANYAASSSNVLVETVGKFSNGPTNPSTGGSNVLTTSNATPAFGDSVTLTDTIAEVGGACPTSLATFTYTTTASATPVTIGTSKAYTQGTGATCVASIATTVLPVGTDSVSAAYPADANYAASSSNVVTETVGKFSNGPTNPSTGGSNVLTSSNATPAFGTSVTLTDTIAETGGACPTSLATFTYTTTASATPVTVGAPTAYTQGAGATCVAAVTTTALPVGTDSVSAAYPADANYAASSSNVVTETVGKFSNGPTNPSTGGSNVLTSSNATPAFGTSVTLTDTIAETGGACPTSLATFTYTTTASATPVAIGNSTYTQGAGATCVAAVTTTTLPVGTDSVTAAYPADANYAASSSNVVTETVGKFSNGPTNPSTGGSNVLTSSNATPAFGGSVTLTDTIAENGGACPTSLATFSYTTTASATPVTVGAPTAYAQGAGATCVAAVTTTTLPVGTDSVTAAYPADANYAASSSNVVTETVGKFSNGPTNPSTGGSNVLTSSNANPAFGGSVTLTDTIAEIGGACPTSLATFTYTTTASATPVAIGNSTYTQGAGATCVAAVTTTTLPVGTDSVTAAYPADANYAASSSNVVTETVGKFSNGPTNPSTGGSNVLTSSNANPAFGGSVTLTDTIAEIGGACPTSLATFTYTTTASATPVAIGNSTYTQGAGATCVAAVTTTTLPVGTDSVTAAYPADANYAASSSNVVTETVGKFSNGPTNPSTGGSNVLTSSNATPAFGGSVTLTDTIAEIGGACPTSLATFTYTTTASATPVAIGNSTYTQGAGATCVAAVTTTTLPVGTDSVTAAYPADANYAASSSNVVTETVGKFSNGPTNPSTGGSNVLTTSNANPAFGGSVTLTDTIAENGGACPTSLATFSYTTTASATPVAIGNSTYTQGVGATCVAAVTTTTLPVGTDSVTAAYPADANYAASSSNVVTETVGKFSNGPTNPSTGGSNVLTTSNATPAFGGSVTLTDTIAEIGGACPTSLATFTYTTTASATPVAIGNSTYTQGAGATCVAAVTTTALPVGTDSVTAAYPADTNYAASSSNVVTETVGSVTPAAVLSANPTNGDVYGGTVILTDTLTPVNGVCPAGTVTFSDGSITLGTGTINPIPSTGTPTSCAATLSTTNIPAGSTTVTAVYPGGGSFGPVTSMLPYTVAKGGGPLSDTLTTSNPNPSFGGSVTLTDTIPELNGVCPVGPATFTSNGVVLTATAPITQGAGATCVATYTTSALPAGSDTVQASFPADANYLASTSNTLIENVGVTGTNGSLAANPATGDTFGSPVTLTETIAPINGTCPTGTVTFTDGTVALGTGTIMAVPATGTPTSCVATAPATKLIPSGSTTITASYPGNASFGGLTSTLPYTVAPAASTGDTLTANPNTNVAFGTSVTLTFTVPLVNGVQPTGTVTFTSGGVTLGTATPNASGVATIMTAALPVGNPDTVTATYAGDANYATGAPTATVQVVPSTTGATLTANPATGDTFGSPVTLTETIAPVGGTCPTGTVTFTDGTVALGTGTIMAVPATGTPTSCVATAPATKLIPSGSTTITANYPGGGSFQPITSTLPYTVAPAASTGDTLTANPNTNVAFGTSVTLTFTVPLVNGVAPTGTVTFTSGGVTLGTATPNASGVATIMTTALPVGNPDTVTATYAGDANYATGAPTATVQVVPSTTGATLTANPATGDTFGSPVTLTETIAPVGGTCPTGTVTFTDGTVALGTGTIMAVPATGTPTSCVATAPATKLIPSGSTTITANYPGGGSFQPITSTLPYTVAPAASTGDTLTANPNTNVAFGTSVTLTFTVPLVNGVQPTGTVTFTSGGVTLGTATPNASGVATIMTTALPVGNPDTVTATYAGDANYATGAPTATVQVVPSTTGATLTANPATGDTFGSPVTLTETIAPVGGTCPTGTVTFTDGTVALGTGTIMAVPATGTPTSCVATAPATKLIPSGSTTITAIYPGGGSFQPITSTLPYTVAPAASTGDTLTANPNTNVAFGTSVTLTFTVPLVNGVAPTGTVTFTYTSGNATLILGIGTVTASGVATINTTALPVGNPDTVKATYTGDANYATGAPTATVQVVQANTTPTLTVSTTTPTYGQPITLTETIPEVNGVCPVGPVTFTYNGTAVGTGTVTVSNPATTPATCVASLTTTALPAGTDNLQGTLPPDTNYTGGPSNVVPVTVAPATPPATIVISPTPAQPGQPVTITETITPVNGMCPAGTVTFNSGSATLGTGTITTTTVNGTLTCVATTTVTSLPSGTTIITGNYPGGGNFGTITAGPATVTITDFTIVGLTTNTINPGDTTTFPINLGGAGAPFNSTVTLAVTAGLPPGAIASFSPASLVPGAGPTLSTLTITTLATQARLERMHDLRDISYGLLLLPLLGFRRVRRKLRSLPKGVLYPLVMLLMLGTVGSLTGCAGGYFGEKPHQYVITVTGTSGTLQHSTTVTLIVE